MSSEHELPIARVVNPISAESDKNLQLETVDKKRTNEIVKQKRKAWIYFCTIHATLAVLIVVPLITLWPSAENEQIIFSQSELREFCANENNQEWNRKILENTEQIDFGIYRTILGGEIPAFAFQCNLGLILPEYIEIVFDLEENVSMNKNALKGTNGKRVGTWNTFINKYTFRTNGHKLTFPKNTFSTNVFEFVFSGWVEFEFTDVNEITMNEKSNENVGHLELSLVSNEENFVDATEAGYSIFSSNGLPDKLQQQVTDLDLFSSDDIDFTFNFLEFFNKLERLELGNLKSISNYESDKVFKIFDN
eukprot:snap_masked-scaffold_21-processed-gene-3.21-mRNA-1 protein AED:1.00 eAED:1.00 QI:0/0/0/0/1/1/2/0/306